MAEARNWFSPLTQDAIPDLAKAFEVWQNVDTYMLLEGVNVQTGEKKRLAVKCSKRGNDVYARRLDRKLGFLGKLDNEQFFNAQDCLNGKLTTTRVLWVTLTYDSKLCSLDEAWNRVSSEYNVWITNLRNKYGRIDVLGFKQPFPDETGEAYGYPHLHLIMMFKDHEFLVFPRMEMKDGVERLVFRIEEKDQVAAQGKYHSFIDVAALSSMRTVSNYCRKYAQSVCSGSSSKAVLNCAVNWLYRKQTYSMSRSFREDLSEFIGQLRSSKVFDGKFQVLIDGSGCFPVWVWRMYGFCSAGDLGITGDTWEKALSVDEFECLANALVRGGITDDE